MIHRLVITLSLLLSLSACALFPQHDPVSITVVGIQPLPSQELEMRMAVKLRLLNPNDSAINYNGVYLDLVVNGQPLASGVSDQSGVVERFSEEVLVVPVSITAFSVLRQAVGFSQVKSLDGLPYVVRGKLAGGLFGTVRFSDSGTLKLPPSNVQGRQVNPPAR